MLSKKVYQTSNPILGAFQGLHCKLHKVLSQPHAQPWQPHASLPWSRTKHILHRQLGVLSPDHITTKFFVLGASYVGYTSTVTAILHI